MPKASVTKLKTVATKPPLPKRKFPPIPANVAAIWGAFLYEGLLACYPDMQRGKEILNRCGRGCDQLMSEVCAFLPEVWKQIEPRWYEKDFPGVFEYEVISPLAVNIGDYILLNNGELPPRSLVQSFIGELITDFFMHSPARAALDRDVLGGISS